MRLTIPELQQHLPTDNARKAFWINIYNAYFLLLRQQGWQRPDIFGEPLVPVAGKRFSLDEIEHGILRRCRSKWALGYLPSPFFRRSVYRLMLQRPDYRIHFALNCGARGCPPIGFYREDQIQQQLDTATHGFLEQETVVDETHKILHTTRLMRWYLGDFGGFHGIRQLLVRTLGLKPQSWRIHFQSYDWRESLYRFSS
ncbi:MAG: DUF547 domain-containing protein [bacterium]|nr:DUF547 domain-containing protein [bacterium]